MLKQILSFLFGPSGESDAEAEQRRVAENTRTYARGLQARMRWESQVEEARINGERDHSKE